MAITRATTLSGLVGGGVTLSPTAASITAENITGFAATFNSNVTAASNFDVDGRSSLDDVNIAEGLNVTGGITTVAGQATIGNLTVGASCTITGALTYEDVTNIDSIGLITARNGLQVLAGITTLAGQSNLTNVNVSGTLTAPTQGNTTVGFLTCSGFDSNTIMWEKVNVVANKLSAAPNINLDSGMVHYFTTAETTTSTPNIQSTVGLNTQMSNGDAVTCTIVTTAAAAGYSTGILIDGVATSPVWNGGSDPSAGGSSGLDVYTFNIIKTGSAAYTVLGNVSNFA